MGVETKVTHTPGPWDVEEMMESRPFGERQRAFYVGAFSGWAFGGRTVAIVGDWNDRPNAAADARLIAASPDLLEALRAMVKEMEQIAANRAYKAGLGASEWESFVNDPERLALDTAYAAIRKATEGSD